MLTEVLRLLEKLPSLILLLPLPLALVSFGGWALRTSLVKKGHARRGNACFAGAIPLGVLLSLGAGAFLSLVGRGPEAVYVSEQGGERRLASITTRASRRGELCDVDTWRLADGRFLRADARRGSCRASSDHALVGDRLVDLWGGRIGPSVDKLLQEGGYGPLPGNGDWQIEGRSAESVTLRLQDNTTLAIPWGNGIPATRLEPARDTFEHPELGVFSARELDSDCGCEEPRPFCPALISFLDVAFGDGELFVGALDRGAYGGDKSLLWSQPVKELFGNAGPVFGALEDGGRCVIVVGRSGGRVAAAWLDRHNGALGSRWGY